MQIYLGILIAESKASTTLLLRLSLMRTEQRKSSLKRKYSKLLRIKKPFAFNDLESNGLRRVTKIPSFFHRYANIRKSNNTIKGLWHESGNWVSSNKLIGHDFWWSNVVLNPLSNEQYQSLNGHVMELRD